MATPPVVDLWANVIPPRFSERWAEVEDAEGARRLFGDDLFRTEVTLEGLMAAMDDAGVDAAVLSAPLRPPDSCHADGLYAVEDYVEHAPTYPGRVFVAPTVNEPGRPLPRPRKLVDRIEQVASHDSVPMVRITPFLDDVPLNDRCYYPLYASCEALGLAVSINVGIPGPRARSRSQHPELLEDVLIDFPDLVVIGAHMGHPYEALLVTYMLKWDNLYLSNSAYLADYMDEGLVRFMNSSRGRGRVLFASDHPVLSMQRALEAARKLPLDDEAMHEFLGASAARTLKLGPSA